jgi:hypothetical protein
MRERFMVIYTTGMGEGGGGVEGGEVGWMEGGGGGCFLCLFYCFILFFLLFFIFFFTLTTPIFIKYDNITSYDILQPKGGVNRIDEQEERWGGARGRGVRDSRGRGDTPPDLTGIG